MCGCYVCRADLGEDNSSAWDYPAHQFVLLLVGATPASPYGNGRDLWSLRCRRLSRVILFILVLMGLIRRLRPDEELPVLWKRSLK